MPSTKPSSSTYISTAKPMTPNQTTGSTVARCPCSEPLSLDRLLGQRQRARAAFSSGCAAPVLDGCGPRRAEASAGSRCRRRRRTVDDREDDQRSQNAAGTELRMTACGGAQQPVDDIGLSPDLGRRTSPRAAATKPDGSHQHPRAQHERRFEQTAASPLHAEPATSVSISTPMPTITRKPKKTGATGGRPLGADCFQRPGPRRRCRAVRIRLPSCGTLTS